MAPQGLHHMAVTVLLYLIVFAVCVTSMANTPACPQSDMSPCHMAPALFCPALPGPALPLDFPVLPSMKSPARLLFCSFVHCAYENFHVQNADKHTILHSCKNAVFSLSSFLTFNSLHLQVINAVVLQLIKQPLGLLVQTCLYCIILQSRQL